MNRTGLWIALGIGVVTGLAFGLWPQLDVTISGLFFNLPAPRTWLTENHTVFILRTINTWIIAAIAGAAGLALIAKMLAPARTRWISIRAAAFLLITLILGPGFLTNAVLKEHWLRSRPAYLIQFGGEDHFTPWWDPRGDCPGNCSFVAGEPSGAFWTMALAPVAPPQWRVAVYGITLTYGLFIGALRLMAGGHFASDVIFAGVFTFLVIWLVHGVLYRWRLPWFGKTAPEPRVPAE